MARKDFAEVAANPSAMQDQEAVRRLVKSRPELWAQCSDPVVLARHLSGLGEIRITGLDPESTVAWEGESVSGTVTLEACGWGTRVRLTAGPSSPAEVARSAPPPIVFEPVPAPRRVTERISAFLARHRRAEPAAVQAPVAGLPVEESQEQPPGEAPAPELLAELEAALESLGQAHRRPYSRT